ncbi:MAG: glycosyltransferase, partial [Bacteroidales bacterium]
MATYNGEKYIKEQLDSILCQIGDDSELIISDDGSTDSTLDIIRAYNDERIKVFIHEKKENKLRRGYKNLQYVYKNFENALIHAKGDYIFLSDQDDIWLSNKVERMMQEFDKEVQCILHNNIVVNNESKVLLESFFQYSKPSQFLMRFLFK